MAAALTAPASTNLPGSGKDRARGVKLRPVNGSVRTPKGTPDPAAAVAKSDKSSAKSARRQSMSNGPAKKKQDGQSSKAFTRIDSAKDDKRDQYNGRLDCSLCQKLAKKEKGEAFCPECHMYLCQRCSKAHRKSTNSKTHKLLSGVNMPLPPLPVSSDCRQHGGEPFKYFCGKHEEPCCEICRTLTHKRCGELKELQVISGGTRDTQSFQTTYNGLKKLLLQYTRLKYIRDGEIRDIERQRTETINGITVTRLGIDLLLDKLETTMKFQLEKVYEKQIRSRREEIMRTDGIIHDLRQQLDALDDSINGTSESTVYIELNKSKKALTKQQDLLQQMKGDSPQQLMQFNLDRGLEELAGGIRRFNEIKIKVPATGASIWRPFRDRNIVPVGDFNARRAADSIVCDISSIAILSSGMLVLTDLSNLRLKLFDTTFKGLSELRFVSKPFNTTEVNADELAVTLPNKKQIAFISLDQMKCVMKADRCIGTEAQCLGILYHDGRLLVGCQNPAQLQILDLTGVVLKTVKTGPDGKDLFEWPNYLTMSPDRAFFYTSDSKKGCVYAITTGGTVLMKYEHRSLQGPIAVTADPHGNVFVAGYHSNNMKMLSFDGQQERPLKMPGLNRPQGLCFIASINKLVVSSYRSDTVKVFDIQ